MAWPLIAAMGGMELGKGLISWFNRRKVPKAGETATGRMLQKRASEGIYDPATRQRIVGAAGRTSGAAAQTTKAGIRGGLVRSGMHGSVAGAKLLAQPGLRRSEVLAETGERLETANELSKKQGEEGFAMLEDQLEDQGRESRREGLQGLYSGLLGAGGTVVRGVAREKLATMESGKYAPYAAAEEAGVRIPSYGLRSASQEQGWSQEQIQYMMDRPDEYREQYPWLFQ